LERIGEALSELARQSEALKERRCGWALALVFRTPAEEINIPSFQGIIKNCNTFSKGAIWHPFFVLFSNNENDYILFFKCIDK